MGGDKDKQLPFRTETEFFDAVVPADHPFRTLLDIIDWAELAEPLHELYSDVGEPGIDPEKGLKCLVVQFWEDYSDRQMEHAVRENMAVRGFTGFGFDEKTPDHSYFGKLRKRLGTKRIANLFDQVNTILKSHNLFGETFSFIDASAIITKNQLWKERDKAIADGLETLNNITVKKYAADKQARWGAKGKHNIWFGYKRHHSVDMRYGLIAKVAVTNASVLDYQVVESVLPKTGMVFCDKLYDVEEAMLKVKAKGLANATILKRNRKAKIRDLDCWRSQVRMPFESVFSKLEKRARYRSTAKVTAQAFLEATVHNLKKAITVLPRAMPV
jgi:transposase, IS5 family